MVYFRKKGAFVSGTLVYIISAMVFVVVFLLILDESRDSVLNEEFLAMASCKLSNTIKCGGTTLTFFPNLCSFIEVEEPITHEQLGSALRDTYWMYMRSECNFENVGASIYQVFSFKPKEDIPIAEFLGYLHIHDRGKDLTKSMDFETSDLAYLEANTIGPTICFDARFDSIGAEFTLKQDQTYYVHYWDRHKKEGDKLVITEDPYYDIANVDKFIQVPGEEDFDTTKFILRKVATGFTGGLYVPAERVYQIWVAEKPGQYCLSYEQPTIEGATNEEVFT